MVKITLSLVLGFLPCWAYGVELVHTTATLSEARAGLAATSVGNLALFAGGYNESGPSDVVDIYDADTGTWSTATLSQPRGDLAATSVGNLAFFAGGEYGSSDYSDVVDIYDADTGTWSTTTLSQPRTRLSATSVGSLAFFAGGENKSGLIDVVDLYDVHAGEWATATLSQPKWVVAASVGSKAMFAFGDIVDIYDNDTSCWYVDIMPEGVVSGSATTVGAKALFAGLKPNTSETYFIYDDTVNQWSTDAQSHPWGGIAAATIGNKALFAGGYFPRPPDGSPGDGYIGGDDLDIIRAYWGQNVSPGDKYHGDISGDGFVGGDDLDWVRARWGEIAWDEIEYSNNVEVYENDTGLWSFVELSQHRGLLAGATVDDMALFAGGRYGQESYSDVVDIYLYTSLDLREIPEPSALVLLSIGILGLLFLLIYTRGRKGDILLYCIKQNVPFSGPGDPLRRFSILLPPHPSFPCDFSAARGRPRRSIMVKITLSLVLGFLPCWAYGVELVHTTATLSEARAALAATSVGNLALFAGGYNESGPSDVVDIYNADTSTWTTATLSQPRSYLAATSVGNLAIFAGGTYGSPGTSTYSDVVDIYNTDTETWSTTTLSQPGTYPNATSVGNLAMFAGGYGENGSSDVVDIYDVQTGLWSTATLSEPHGGAATTVGHKALFVGWGENDVVADIYDNQTQTWTTDVTAGGGVIVWDATATCNKAFFVGSRAVRIYDEPVGQWSVEMLSEYREFLAATAVGSKALFAGGVVSYLQPTGPGDLDGDGWVIGNDLDIVRYYWGQTVPPGDKMHGDASGDGFVGGDDLDIVRANWGIGYPDFKTFDTIDVYDDDTGLWSVETLSQARHSLAGTTVGDVAIFAGGRSPFLSNVVDLYTLSTDVQQVVPEPITPIMLFIGIATLMLVRHAGR